MDNQESVKMDNNQEFYVRYKIKNQELEAEMEAKGTQEHCNQNALAFFSVVQPAKPIQMQLPMPVEHNTPMLGKSNGASEIKSGNNGNDTHQTPPDLSTLYLEIFTEDHPGTQYEVICFVTDYYKTNRDKSFLTLEDYKEAFVELKRATVEPPENLRSSVSNTRTAKYLYSPEDGKFDLTTKGGKLVQSLKAKKHN